ncbi:MAG: hypothetical protein Q4A83_05415 [Bacillota bacterium]|nr:hypothetical protein [Bacillota bacterium]
MNFSDAVIDALGELDDELVAEIYEPKKKKRGAVIGALALAACAAIIIVGSGLLKDPPHVPDITAPPAVTQNVGETQSPVITQAPTPQPTQAPRTTPAPQPEGISLVINRGEPVKYSTARQILYVDPERWEGDADADADDDADADADDDSDVPEDTKRYMRYEEIMSFYGISLDVQQALPDYRMYNMLYYYPEDAHNNVFEYYSYSGGRGNLIISIHDGSVTYFNSDGMTATDIHGTSVIAAENGGVYVASFSKGGLYYFVRADRLAEEEFTKLLEVLI